MTHTGPLKPLGRVLVTGAVGYLGSRIVRYLDPHAEVIGLTRPTGPALDDIAGLRQAIERAEPDHVVHAAGRVFGDEDVLRHDNEVITRTLANAVLDAAPGAILSVLGSAAEYGVPPPGQIISEHHACKPVSAYGLSKLAATRAVLHLVESRGLRANIVRPFNLLDAPLSPAQVVGAFVSKAQHARYLPRSQRRILMGRLDAVRDFLVVSDLLQLIRAIVGERRQGMVVNACSGTPRKVRDIISFMNGLPGGGFEVLESDGPARQESAVIGDTTQFFAVSGLQAATAIEPVLMEAWRDAMNSR